MRKDTRRRKPKKKKKSNFCIGKSHMHPMTFDLRLNAKRSQ